MPPRGPAVQGKAVGQLGHERQTEAAVQTLLRPVRSAELSGALYLYLEPVFEEESDHVDRRRGGAVLDIVGDGLRASDADVEHPVICEAGLLRHLLDKPAPSRKVGEVRR